MGGPDFEIAYLSIGSTGVQCGFLVHQLLGVAKQNDVETARLTVSVEYCLGQWNIAF